MKKFLLSALMLFALGSMAWAQTIEVTDFTFNEHDLTPLQPGTMVLDQNGDKCALIKIITTVKGFTFDVGSLGVMKTDDKHTGEIWVYVPYGINKITLSHPEYGQLRNFPIPVSIEKGRTYIMKLKTKRLENSNTLTLKYSPANAVVLIDGKMVTGTNGVIEKELSIGKHEYSIVAQGYNQLDGLAKIEKEEPTVINVQLVPSANSSVAPASQPLVLGIRCIDVFDYLDSEKNKSNKIELGTDYGIYIAEITTNGAAEDAGLKIGDVIVSIDGKKITKLAELQEYLFMKKLGDQVKVTYLRNKNKKEVTMTLKNQQGNTKVVDTSERKDVQDVINKLTFEDVNNAHTKSAIYSARINGNNYFYATIPNHSNLAVIVAKKGAYKNFEEVVLPDTFQTNDGRIIYIVGIANEAFYKCKKIKKVVLPKYIRYVGNSAFKLCSIDVVIFNKGILGIGNNAFEGNLILNIELPEGIKEIGDLAFSAYDPTVFTLKFKNTSRATNGKLYLPKSLEKIGKHAFGMSRNDLGTWWNSKRRILCLPDFIDTSNCKDYGISIEPVQEYFSK